MVHKWLNTHYIFDLKMDLCGDIFYPIVGAS